MKLKDEHNIQTWPVIGAMVGCDLVALFVDLYYVLRHLKRTWDSP